MTLMFALNAEMKEDGTVELTISFNEQILETIKTPFIAMPHPVTKKTEQQIDWFIYKDKQSGWCTDGKVQIYAKKSKKFKGLYYGITANKVYVYEPVTNVGNKCYYTTAIYKFNGSLHRKAQGEFTVTKD